MPNKHNNPFHHDDHWKNKARLESIKAMQEREALKQQQKVQESIESLLKHLPKK